MISADQKEVCTIHPEVRVIDTKAGIVDYIASDETVDCYREVIAARGWLFDLFRKNAPLVNSHDYADLKNQLGKITDFFVRDGKLHNRAQFALDVPSNELARLTFDMVEKGYVKACSVGFMPVEWLSRWNNEQLGDFTKECERLKVDPGAVGTIFTKQQQLELSVCILGANQNALAEIGQAVADGAVDRDLAGRVVGKFLGTPNTNTTPASSEPAGAVTARACQEFLEQIDRMDFLKKFDKSLNQINRK
ncbi:MAG: HK97 family phage prohead protease [Verrucomicrobiales bacterium]|nr:HK97 family phage prohead protease [Verrucomicrobiales bacterium]